MIDDLRFARLALERISTVLSRDAEALAALRVVSACVERMERVQPLGKPVEATQCCPPALPGPAAETDMHPDRDAQRGPPIPPRHVIANVPHTDARLSSVVQAIQTEGRFPFDLDIKSRPLPPDLSSALTGPSIYLLVFGSRVVYAGKYRPIAGSVVEDRWFRHLQTVTLRGSAVGLGGLSNPERRLARLLEGVQEPSLRTLLTERLEVDRGRFRDTGVNTTVNRVAFAAKHWAVFGSAQSASIFDGFSFHLFRLAGFNEQARADEAVSAVEKALLDRVFPRCNRQFVPSQHEHLQDEYTPAYVMAELIRVADKLGLGFSQTVRLA
ncbi:MAG: hypothetical protein L6Q69_01690 [Zoogloea sp.]|nr:hypothetical protein [Zoogloea sp.]